jgi:hypothetical protein
MVDGVVFPRDLVILIVNKYTELLTPQIAYKGELLVVLIGCTLHWGELEFIRGSKHNQFYHEGLIDVACGVDFAVAVTRDGFLSWGNNDCGLLGLGDFAGVAAPTFRQMSGRMVAVSCGHFHTMAIVRGSVRGENRLFGWGYNHYNQIGLKLLWVPNFVDITVPEPQYVDVEDATSVVCGWNYSLILARGYLWICNEDHDSSRYIKKSGDRSVGPRKLDLTGVVGAFACCTQFVVWTVDDMYIYDDGRGIGTKCCSLIEHQSVRAGPDRLTHCKLKEMVVGIDISTITERILHITGSARCAIIVTYGKVYAVYIDGGKSEGLAIPVVICDMDI